MIMYATHKHHLKLLLSSLSLELLLQIRLMVGAAIAEANGIVPPGWVQAGLTVPYVLQFPLAPAEGLLLVSQGFTAGKTGVYVRVMLTAVLWLAVFQTALHM
jgi:hypothetical protein